MFNFLLTFNPDTRREVKELLEHLGCRRVMETNTLDNRFVMEWGVPFFVSRRNKKSDKKTYMTECPGLRERLAKILGMQNNQTTISSSCKREFVRQIPESGITNNVFHSVTCGM